ncbi:MAG: CRISPR-associated endonuclease Cas1 [Myxococcales bacterium]|nr:CRISPR-associated endonuclease Cas1 [Myxococcales bacterium]
MVRILGSERGGRCVGRRRRDGGRTRGAPRDAWRRAGHVGPFDPVNWHRSQRACDDCRMVGEKESRSGTVEPTSVDAARSEAEPTRAKWLSPDGLVSRPPDLIPAGMIRKFVYCERLFYLEWCQKEFEDNEYTLDGSFVHRRVDRPGGTLPAPRDAPRDEASDEAGAADDDPGPVPDRPARARSLELASERLGVTARLDVVEEQEDGSVVPVEYKRGERPAIAEGAWPSVRAQVCLHVLLLREHGYRCPHGFVYYADEHARVPIEITDELVQMTLRAVERAREVARAGRMPPPLVNDRRCDGCSLVTICLPDEVTLLRRDPSLAVESLHESDAAGPEARRLEAPPDAPPIEGPEPPAASLERASTRPLARVGMRIRPLAVRRDEREPLHVASPGASVSLQGERLLVVASDEARGRMVGRVRPQPRRRMAASREGGGDSASAPGSRAEASRSRVARLEARLPMTSQVCLYGNVHMSTAAIRTCIERGIPVVFFSAGGWYLGRTIGHDSKNVELRRAQHRAAGDPELCLQLARGFVASKILNARTLLRRNWNPPGGADAVVLSELRNLAHRATLAPALESLLGIEGTAARIYFGAFRNMLADGPLRSGAFDFEGRNRRPPRDPLNALLSFAYAMLCKDFEITCAAVGFDPYVGYYHQPRFGRPALALDLMEEFRPLIADSVVLSVINNRAIGPEDFVYGPGGCNLSRTRRAPFIEAYQRRLDETVTHPVFGYPVSYRHVFELQARLLGRFLLGEIDFYPAFRTR